MCLEESVIQEGHDKIADIDVIIFVPLFTMSDIWWYINNSHIKLLDHPLKEMILLKSQIQCFYQQLC